MESTYSRWAIDKLHSQEHADPSLVLSILGVLAARDGLCEEDGATDKNAGHPDGCDPGIVEDILGSLLKRVADIDSILEIDCSTRSRKDLCEDGFWHRSA